MRRIGVIPAAGLSTRLPDKIFMPIDENRIAIHSAIDFCVRNHCSSIHIVVNSFGIVPRVIEMTRHRAGISDPVRLMYVVQREPKGVCDALTHVEPLHGVEMLVAFPDNVYDKHEVLPEIVVEGQDTCSFASVRSQTVCAPCNKELDLYCPYARKWMKRGHIPEHSDLCFAGWMLIRRLDWIALKGRDELVGWMNACKVEALQIGSDRMWYDIGTPDSYYAYLTRK